MLQLPSAMTKGVLSVEEALNRRRSIREYAGGPLTVQEVGQLLWSGYGVTGPKGLRTAPSARALYPLELYVVAENVTALPPGVYRYDPAGHALATLREGSILADLGSATFGQDFVGTAAAVLVFTGIYERTREAFQDAGRDYLHMDLGHAGQNVHLQAVALDLGTVVVGAFRPAEVRDLLDLPADRTPLYLMPVGRLR